MIKMQLPGPGLTDLTQLLPSDVRIEDIAHGLSLINRFNGATKMPYSVAQHSVIMSEQVHPDIAMHALLHDAHEYIVGDIATPVAMLFGPDVVDRIRTVKKMYDKIIGEALHIDLEHRKDEIKMADFRMLITEGQQLFEKDTTDEWKVNAPPYDIKITPWDNFLEGRYKFLDRYMVLAAARNCKVRFDGSPAKGWLHE